MIKSFELGASLYVPAIHKDLINIIKGNKLSHVRSIIICLEDSILENDIEFALRNLEDALFYLRKKKDKFFFIRVRNSNMIDKILSLRNINEVNGFVLPKIHADNIREYQKILDFPHFQIMPTLETKEALSESEMLKLLSIIQQKEWKERILVLRIGANDLFNLLGIRRPRNKTIYDTPLANIISHLISIFKPYGFELSAPVFENIANIDLLMEEVTLDVEWGLLTKTAIHPSQVKFIENAYKVSDEDKCIAESILSSEKAIFAKNGLMQEKATHSDWAEKILSRYDLYH